MAHLPFIDTHVHFYDLEEPDLRYDLLKPGAQHEIIEDIRAIKASRYWADDWLAETRFANVVKSIHVQCAGGSRSRRGDSLNPGVRRPARPPARHRRRGPPRTAGRRGRDRASHGLSERTRCARVSRRCRYLGDAAWRRGFALLGKHQLVSCVHAKPETYPDVKRLASDYPDMRVCLDHAGFPRQRDDAYFDFWRRQIGLGRGPQRHREDFGLDIGDTTLDHRFRAPVGDGVHRGVRA